MMNLNDICEFFFHQVDIDENRDIAVEYDVSTIPTFVFIKNKSQIDAFLSTDTTQLENTINQHLSHSTK